MRFFEPARKILIYKLVRGKLIKRIYNKYGDGLWREHEDDIRYFKEYTLDGKRRV